VEKACWEGIIELSTRRETAIIHAWKLKVYAQNNA
jgi:hypothetical protein